MLFAVTLNLIVTSFFPSFTFNGVFNFDLFTLYLYTFCFPPLVVSLKVII